MQMDTGSEEKLIPKNFWESIGKAALRKSRLQLHLIDESARKTFGQFEGSLELEDNTNNCHSF